MNLHGIARYVGISGTEKFEQNSVVNFLWHVDAGAFEAEHTVSAMIMLATKVFHYRMRGGQ